MRADRRRLWLRWLVTVTVGEAVGFTLPAVVGATALSTPAGVPLLLLAGAVEGAVLGLSQWWVLRRIFPTLPAPRWIGATAAAAVVAYVLGGTPSATEPVWGAWPSAVAVLVAAPLGAALLVSIGVAQWLVLRRLAARSSEWVWWTAGAWLAGLTAFLMIATPLWNPGQPLAWVIAVGVGAGVVMAATVAAVSGFGVLRLAAAAARTDPAPRH